MLHHMGGNLLTVQSLIYVEGYIGVFGDDGNGGDVQDRISFLSPVTKVSKERQAKKVEQEV